MNFINHNLENLFPEFFSRSLTEFPNNINNDMGKPIDNTFNEILEKSFDSSVDEKKVADSSLEVNQVKDNMNHEKVEKSDSITNITDEDKISEKRVKQEKISKILELLQKIIQKKELSVSEQAYLFQNLNFLKENIVELLGKQNVNALRILDNQALTKLLSINNEIKLPTEAMEQIKKIAQLLKETKEVQISQKKGDSATNSLEKLADLGKLLGEKSPEAKQIKVEDAYIKNQDRFNVLKGNKVQDHTNQPIKIQSSLQSTEEFRANPSHQKTTVNNTVTTKSVMGQVQNNLVINASSVEGKDFAGQGFSQSSSSTPLNKASGLFTQNGLPQSINFKNLVQHLTGRIYNGFVTGKQVMLVKLQPENLGPIQILLKKETENSLHLKLKVDSLEVKELLDKSSQEIRLELNKDKLDLLSFDVDVNDRSTQSGPREEKGEKKFNDFLSTSGNVKSDEESGKTVDLRIRANLLNIKI